MMTGDGHRLPPFLRHDIERMIRHYEFIGDQLAEVEADRKLALTDDKQFSTPRQGSTFGDARRCR
jgi:hypothetical protein